MGVLARFFEEEGLATTQISLIREHTKIIKPPRALWVPFDLGRPLGVPNDPAFQTKVLLKALELLEAPHGPVLMDFPEDAPAAEDQEGPLACPVNFTKIDEHIGAANQMISAFKQEVLQMQNWYDLAVQKRGRTTVGLTGLPPEKIADFLASFVQGDTETNPQAGVSLAMALRMAIEDLKAYYLEAMTAQPGQSTDSATLANWFWSQTATAKMINTIREICLGMSGDEFQILGKFLLIPRNQLHLFAK